MEAPPATGPNPAPSSCGSKSCAETCLPAGTPLPGLGVPGGTRPPTLGKATRLCPPNTPPCPAPKCWGQMG